MKGTSSFNRADPVALKKAGNASFGKGEYAEAVEHYTAAIDLWMEPADRAVLYSNRCAAKLKLPGERQKALNDAKRACELAPDYAKGHFRRGQALRALGDPDGAVAAMEHVLRLAPEDAAATAELAELRGALGGAAKPRLGGSLQPGTHVTPNYGKGVAGSPPLPFALPGEDSPFVRPVERTPGVADAATGREAFVNPALFDQANANGDVAAFISRAEERRREHEQQAAASRPTAKAVDPSREILPGTGSEWPEGFGPNAPGWDPTYKYKSVLDGMVTLGTPSGAEAAGAGDGGSASAAAAAATATDIS